MNRPFYNFELKAQKRVAMYGWPNLVTVNYDVKPINPANHYHYEGTQYRYRIELGTSFIAIDSRGLAEQQRNTRYQVADLLYGDMMKKLLVVYRAIHEHDKEKALQMLNEVMQEMRDPDSALNGEQK